MFVCLYKRLTFRFFFSTVLLALILAASPFNQTAQAQTPSIKTDRAVYNEPALPSLPKAGGTYTDPMFGTTVLRATDEAECPAPGCGTYYSHWPTFNVDNTFILVRNGVNGAALVKPFDPVNFTTGKGHQPGGIYVPGYGTTTLNFQSAIWHPTDPHLIYCFPTSYDGGAKLFTYNVVTREYTIVKDFGPVVGPQDYLWQMSMSKDGDVFAWSQLRSGRGADPVAYIVWRKSTDQLLYHVNTTPDLVNEVRLDKSGQFLAIPYNRVLADGKKFEMLNISTGAIDYGYWNPTDSPTGHGDVGSGFNAGWDNWACGINRHSLDKIHSTQVVLRFQDEKGVTDWTNDFHGTLLADDESWMVIGTYDYPGVDLPETYLFENEIVQVKLDGSGEFRRLLHTRTEVDLKSETTGYWATPKPTISRDGRFIAYTSNWEGSGRYDLFIARIEPAGSSTQPAASPALVSTAHSNAVTLAGSAGVTEAQVRQLATSVEQAYNTFMAESDRFSSPTQMQTGLRAALYFSRAAAALAATGVAETGVQNRLDIAASYLAQVRSLMETNAPATGASSLAHAVAGGSFNIGPADTLSNASFLPLLSPQSIGVIIGDPSQSPLAAQTKSAAASADGRLPFELEGVSVTIGGRSAQLITISPSRVTFFVPEGLPDGEAEVIVTTEQGNVSRGTTVIAKLAPALFAASGDGTGPGLALNAATYTRGDLDVTTDHNLTADKRTRVMLFATGVSHGAANADTTNDVATEGGKIKNLAESVTVEARAANGRTWRLPVEFAGTTGVLPGLDQVNVILLPELKGAGVVELTVIVGEAQSNKVTVKIR